MCMIRKQLYIDDDLNVELGLLAARTGKAEAEHVRAALRDYLRKGFGQDTKGPDPLLQLVGMVDDVPGPDDVAEHHDAYLYGDERPA